ncbi:MAG: hypothetical protein HC866_16010 [Leptolyngbyaceae cyanobacterium RU_5_1]|nr:hypothetical protein [Leptolyngbyaceae cyanobacterium RU_5_1]
MNALKIPFLANSLNLMESIDWVSVAPAAFAIAIFIGGMLMMFAGIWNSRDR